jgi:signal transduction histidine kinase
MKKKSPFKNLTLVFILLWFGFSLSLSIWQFYFISTHFKNLQEQNINLPLLGGLDIPRVLRMIQQESLALIFTLTLGGLALIYFYINQAKQNQQLKVFFSTFSHELKTSIATLKLKAESLDLIESLSRLELQLENSLILSKEDYSNLHLEKHLLSDFIKKISHSLSIPIHLKQDCYILVDYNAFDSILKNLVLNSVKHGSSQNFYISAEKKDSKNVVIEFKDDGEGFQGDYSKLSQLFYRPQGSSGNGIGLYLIRSFTKAMHGEFIILPSKNNGFTVQLTLVGEILSKSARVQK